MASGLWGGITIIVMALLFGFAAIAFILTWMRSHRLRVRDPMNQRAYINEYWVLEKKDKETGVLKWVSVLGKKVLSTPAPPAKAIEIGKRGRKFAEAYRISEDEFVWITDKGLRMEKKDGKDVAVDIQEDGTHKVIDTFKPFSPVQRETVVSQYRRAAEIRAKRWDAQKVISLVGMSFIAIIVIFIIIYWGEIWGPAVDIYSRAEARETRIMQWELEHCNLALTGEVSQTGTPQGGTAIVTEGETPATFGGDLLKDIMP